MSSVNNVRALKSGVWYTAANFITKSIGFITTPIFTRLLSHSNYGLYSNYVSWQNTFVYFATLSLGASFISAKYDYSDHFDGYVSSVLVLSSLVTAIWAIVINLAQGFFKSLMGLDIKYINIMMVYYLMYSAVDMFQVRERYLFKYKVSVLTSLLIAFSTAALSVILVVFMDDKLFGRIAGSVIPTIIAGAGLYYILMKRGCRVDVSYWKYALLICIPFIPHLLSLSLLNSMDKMMITKICGAEENALYSVAYTCGAVITLLVTSLNTAFAPWLGEKLNEKNYGEIKRISKLYILTFVYLACGVMLITPELLLVMGGSSYSGAIHVMPPVAFGCVCQFLYTMYVNVEQFSKKTVGMAIASVVAALSNYILNSIFIPRVGYLAAAYTTLASYMILLGIHMLLVKQMGMLGVYPARLIFFVLLFMSAYTVSMSYIYMNTIVRYLILAVFIAVGLCVAVRQKDLLVVLIKKKVGRKA